MSDFLKRLGNLLSVESIIAIILTAVFAYLCVKEKISTEFTTVYAVVIAFYYGTTVKSKNKEEE